MLYSQTDLSIAALLLITPLITLAQLLLEVLLALSAKWIILGRAQPGVYALWGGTYLRWWFARLMLSS